MNEPVIDRMSRELATARRWATTMAERVWQLEDAIRTHRDGLYGDRDVVPLSYDDVLHRLIGDDDV